MWIPSQGVGLPSIKVVVGYSHNFDATVAPTVSPLSITLFVAELVVTFLFGSMQSTF